jgi:membrane AbrB-like protein
MRAAYRTAAKVLVLNLATIAAGLVGGVAALYAKVPLPFFLGAMMSSAIYAMFAPSLISPRFRNIVIAVLGVLIGSEFTIPFLHAVVENFTSLAFIIPYTLIATAIIFTMLLRTTSLDLTTAYFSAVPGGVQEMTMLGTDRGGSEATLAVHHSLRVTLVIIIVSLVFSFASGYQAIAVAVAAARPLAPLDYGWIAAMAIGGLLLGRVLHLPAPFILGPLIVSAIVHLAGVTDVKPDFGLVAFAQVVAGASIGTQFSSFPRRDLVMAGLTAVKISVALILFTMLFVWGVSHMLTQPFPQMLLAYAPGGLGEMGLIALSAGSDAAFVSTGQIFRYFLVVTFAAPCYGLFVGCAERLSGRKRAA